MVCKGRISVKKFSKEEDAGCVQKRSRERSRKYAREEVLKRGIKYLVVTSMLEHLDFAIAEFRDMKMQPSLEKALRHKEILGV
ncbi:hypothetical protein ACFLWS_03055 [Chloroflexota bacterium]